ncbi:MAG: hypothetical protein M1836_003644 [Candelina mexicana]|nr:MAG: hypothetical protein M1836_003644 [Candelina mexicana]
MRVASLYGTPSLQEEGLGEGLHEGAKEDLDHNSPGYYGFAVALKTIPGPDHGALSDDTTYSQLDETLEAHENGLRNMPFPNKVRAEDPKLTVTFAQHYHVISHILEDMEADLRRCTLDGKEEGQIKAADNLAIFYDRVSKAAAALAKDPEADVRLWET